MKLCYHSDYFLKNLFDEVSLLTNKATLLIRKVEYNQKNGTLFLPIKRYGFIDSSNNFDYSKSMSSSITIRSISDCRIKNICPSSINEVTLLFGIQFEKDGIYLSSAEESKGDTLYEISLKVEDFNFELIDIEQTL
jgi:hypothetical protein